MGPIFYILCKKYCENTQHLLVDCNFTLVVWGRIFIQKNYWALWTGNSLVNCLNLWHKQNHIYPTLSAFTCWFIWQERNMAIFEDQQPTVQRVVHQVLAAMKDHIEKSISVVRRKRQSNLSSGGTIGWFDGAATSSGQNSEARGIIKFNDQCCIKWLLNCGQGTNTREKCLGAWALLTLASRLSIPTIHVQGDSKVIIDWLRDKGRL
jgi:hypothetical protein